MSLIDPARLDVAFVPADAPSFADLIAKLDGIADPTPTRRRDLASGLRRVARALGRAPEAVPAEPAWLRPRLATVAPAALGLTPKSWANAVSDAKAALALFGIVERKPRRRAPLSPLWADLWAAATALGDPKLTTALGRFVQFLDRCGVAPEATTAAHLDLYREALARAEIVKSPERAVRAAARGWASARGRVAGWPAISFEPPSRRDTFALAPDAFPESFRADLDRFIARLAAPDPLDPEAPPRPLRAATLRNRRGQLLRFASALVHDGVPAAEIDGLAALIEGGRAERGLRWLLTRNGGRSSPSIADMAYVLKMVAKRHLRADEAVQGETERLASRLAVPARPGMTPRNRDRLRPFEDEETLRRLLRLPAALTRRAEGRSPAAALRDREMAVAIGILSFCPVRVRNLAEIHVKETLRRPRDGRLWLVFEAEDVKNRRPLEFELPAHVAEMVDALIALRPHEPWLFPLRSGGGPIAPGNLSGRISATLRRELGLEMHPHLFRHLAAMVWLKANPGAYEVARRMLGHAELSSTLNAYAGFEAGTATRLFAELMEARRR